MKTKVSASGSGSRWRRRPWLSPGTPFPSCARGSRDGAGRPRRVVSPSASPRRCRPGEPAAQTALRDPDVSGEVRDRFGALAGQLDGLATACGECGRGNRIGPLFRESITLVRQVSTKAGGQAQA
jgi:hypothetical protein